MDFTAAAYTKPLRTGTTVPGTCSTGEGFLKMSSADGRLLYVCTAPDQWSVIGEVPSSALPVSAANSTALAIGTTCTTEKPCRVRFGGSVYAFTSTVTATLTGGSGTAYIYVTPDGVLTVGHAMALTCNNGCVAQSGVSAFPAGVLPVATWTASNGTWTNGFELAAVQGRDLVTTGAGLVSVMIGNTMQLGADLTVLGSRVAVPASATSSCSLGHWAVDVDYSYKCVAQNMWKRVALTTW